MHSVQGWNFDYSYTTLPNIFYSEQEPNPVKSPKLILLNQSLAKSLGLDEEELQTKKATNIFAGNELPKGSKPIAQAYAGHQFGYFTMLGDGRAVLLGEHITPDGKRVDIQLKGSGRTPYSRNGDGRAALGPMLREYIISEAMYALEIPTTRSLAVVTTGERIIRERYLPGAILTRVASSHIRVGTFQFARNFASKEELKILADYTISRHYPYLEKDESRYIHFLKEVVQNQAQLIAKWQLVGFVHGVMNTDNITISGETIDYGPCAFMDTYNPETVFSSIDTYGRYAYNNQPKIGGWNLARFAESILVLLHDEEKKAIELAQEVLSSYPDAYYSAWLNGMRKKLGLISKQKDDEELITDLLYLMEKYKQDYTNTFRFLTLGQLEEPFFKTEEFQGWYSKFIERRPLVELMKKNNPAVIPRNHLVEEALEAAVEREDFSVIKDLLNILSNPYDYTQDTTKYCTLPENPDEPYVTFCGT